MTEFAANGPKLRNVTHGGHVSPADLELELKKITGVRTVRVVGDDVPVEIHVVAEKNRPPKQVVRDVQSLAAAGFGMSIDHRIVSVVQLDDDEEMQIEKADGRRPVLDRVVFANKGSTGWVKVALQWPDGHVTEGAASSGASREARARGAATAVQQAIAQTLSSGPVLEVDHVMIQQVGVSESVIVRAVFSDGGQTTPLIGSAIIHDDVATAAVHALLQAVNRKLR